MKIIKHGKANRVITCNCGCEFEYEEGDIQCDICTIVSSTVGHKTYYLICPDCGAKIFIQSPVQTYQIQITC